MIQGEEALSVALTHVLPFCEYAGLVSVAQTRKACGRGAVGLCQKIQAQGRNALAVSESNGIELMFCWLQNEAGFREAMETACGRFVRAAASGTHDREIVWNRPPYSDAVSRLRELS